MSEASTLSYVSVEEAEGSVQEVEVKQSLPNDKILNRLGYDRWI